MAIKKYLSLERLTEYDTLIKQEISEGDEAVKSYVNTEVAKKANSSHTHDDRYYTETEIDSKLSAVNTSISNITSGTTVVKEAEHATSADSATTATSADTASNASTLGDTTVDVGSTTKPIYLDNGVAKAGSTYAGGTKVTFNGSDKGGSTASFYAPTGAGTSGYVLTSAGSGAPTWTQAVPVANGGTGATSASGARTNLGVYSTTEVDTALAGKSSTSHNHDSAYDAKGSADTALASAKTYADGIKNDLLNGAGTAYDTLKELGDLIDDNKDAIDALEEIAAGKANATHTHAISDVTNLQTTLDAKATQTSLDTHTNNTTVHITSTERTNWNAAKTHADSAHAPSNAEKNQNAFSNIIVGETTIAADTATDSLTLVGSNVTITPDATNDKVTIAVATGSTSTAGILKLTNSTSSTSTTTAATPSSVKSAYDLANQAKTAAATAQSTADGKADASHTHTVANITDLTVTATELNYMDGVTSNVQTQLDALTTAVNGKAASSHSHTITASASDDDVVVLTGTSGSNKVTYSASHANSGVTAGTYRSVTVNAKGHVTAGTNPTTLSGYGITDAASKTHTHAISDITNLETTLNNASSAISANTSSISAHTDRITALETKVGDGFEEITSAEIQNLFSN